MKRYFVVMSPLYGTEVQKILVFKDKASLYSYILKYVFDGTHDVFVPGDIWRERLLNRKIEMKDLEKDDILLYFTHKDTHVVAGDESALYAIHGEKPSVEEFNKKWTKERKSRLEKSYQ